MKKLRTIEIDKEKVYLCRSVLGYRVVYPIKDPETGKINWFNLIIGGWDNIIIIMFILMLTSMFFYVYWHDTKEMQKVLEDPCAYCGTQELKLTLIQRIIDSENAANKQVTETFERMIKAGEQE